MKTKKVLLTLILGLLLNISFSQTGEELYKAYCTRCHTIGGGQLVGPDLKGTMKKYDEQWMIKWIRSSQALIEAGDEKAVALFKQFNEIQMADNDLTDDEIKSIIAYVRKESGEVISATAQAPGTENKSETTETPASQSSSPVVATASTAPAVTTPAPTAENVSEAKSSFSVDGIAVLLSAAAVVVIAVIILLSRTIMILSKNLNVKPSEKILSPDVEAREVA